MSFYFTERCKRFPNLIKACEILPQVITHPEFILKLSAVQDLDMTDIDGKWLNEKFQLFLDDKLKFMVLDTYRAGNPFSKTLGYYSGGNTQYINERRANRSIGSFVGTIAHEFTHYIDELYPERFGHDGNYSAGKENTAPYFVGTLAEEIYERHLYK